MEKTDTIELVVKYHGDLPNIVAALGGETEVLYRGYAIVTINRAQVSALYTYPQVEHIELPKLLSFEQSSAGEGSCVRRVQEQGAWNLRGKGVLIAIIDSGLDYEHPDFRNADGSSRVRYIWDQTAVGGNPPSGFLSGTEYERSEINAALRSGDPQRVVPYRDERGHGTAVAGIAAGSGRDAQGNALGLAPEAELISVKLGMRGYPCFARSTELMRAVQYVIQKARALAMPLVINISFGMNDGSHQGDSLFERYIDDVANEWKTAIVVPTGNEGAAGHHYAGQVSSYSSLNIPFFTAAGIPQFFLTMWKDFVDNIAVELILPNGRSSGLIHPNRQVNVFRDGNLEIQMQYGQPSHFSLSQQIYIFVRALEGSVGADVWQLRLQMGAVSDGAFALWLPTLEAVTSETFFASPEEENTLTIPSTAQRVISVAGYQERTGSVLDFSGRGPGDRCLPRKPDLAAPAAAVRSSRSGGGYDSFTGTSFAAPFVSGAAALMMEWGIVQNHDPFLYGERLKAFLRIGAERVSGRRYPNSMWGYGTLCVERSMEYLRQYQVGGELWQRI